MTKFLFILILLTGKVYGQQLPTINPDTLCFPVTVVKKILIAAEQKKVLDSNIVLLNKRIQERDSIIVLLKSKEETNIQIIKTYEDEVKIMNDKLALYESQAKQQEKDIKKLKRKQFWTSTLAFIGIGAATALLIVK